MQPFILLRPECASEPLIILLGRKGGGREERDMHTQRERKRKNFFLIVFFLSGKKKCTKSKNKSNYKKVNNDLFKEKNLNGKQSLKIHIIKTLNRGDLCGA